jgi:hypothetical protein
MLAELVQIARVPRTLSLYRDDQINSSWIPGIPDKDFVGTVTMSCPKYLVELSISAADMSSDDESEDGYLRATYKDGKLPKYYQCKDAKCRK